MYTQVIQTDLVATIEFISPFPDNETEIDFADEVRTFYSRIETLIERDEWDGNRRARHDTNLVPTSILLNYSSSFSILNADPDLFFEVMTRAYLLSFAEYVFEITSKTRNLRLDIVWPDNPDLLDLGPMICPKGERLLRLGWLIKYHLELHDKQFPEFLSQKGYVN